MEHIRGVAVLLGAFVLLGWRSGGWTRSTQTESYTSGLPLYFNSYIRRGNLYKRFRDEPILKWSPTYFGTPNMYYDQKREASGCGRENSLCAYVSSTTGQYMTVRCCGALQCLNTGSSYTCADPKSYEEGTDYEYYAS